MIPRIQKIVYDIHIDIYGREAVKGGYFWVVILFGNQFYTFLCSPSFLPCMNLLIQKQGVKKFPLMSRRFLGVLGS